jgi:serine/threonine protein kinase
MWVLKPGDLFNGRYRIQREIGAGGMAFVYAAVDEELHETVALKIIRPELVGEEELVERFKREVRIARQIHHPNVIRIFEFGRATEQDKTFYYLTMELLPGVDLATWLEKRGAISLNEILEIGLQLCDGLDEAHRSGVVHRDIKPQNIFIDENGRATLMDFGISRLATLPGLTSGSQLMGTPRYMSPEQVGGRYELDHRSDIYSLGVVLYELCTRQVPFIGKTPVEIALRHIQDVPEPPRKINAQIPNSLEKVILSCLHKEPDSRYESVGELRAALLAVAQESGVETLFASPSGSGRHRVVTSSNGALPVVSKTTAEPVGDSRSTEATREISRLPTAARSRTVPAERSLVLLVGGLVFIGAVSVLVSLLLLRSYGLEPVEALEGGRADSVPAAGGSETVPSREPSDDSASAKTPFDPSEPEQPASGDVADLASVRISANPGTQIYIDGELVGTVPPVVNAQLSAGSYQIRYVIPGYDEFEETVEVAGGQTNDLAHHFPPFGVLRILCQPMASVRLNGRELGETPIHIKRLREGTHRIVVYREGYRTVDKTIQIRVGQVNRFQFTLAQR